MLRVYFIRHAQSVHNAVSSHLIAGRSSQQPLSQEGLSQAILLGSCTPFVEVVDSLHNAGRFLKAQPCEFHRVVFCSTAVRATHTARIIVREMGLREEDMIMRGDIEEVSQVRD